MKTKYVATAVVLLALGAPAQETPAKALADYRRQIDAIDQRIVAALNERAKVAEQIGRLKRKLEMPVAAPKREREVLENVARNNSGPLPSEALQRIYQRIIAEMTAFEQAGMRK